MQIDVRGVHLKLTDPLVTYVHDHVTQALDRYERRVQSVDVRLSDKHGPRGEPDRACVLQVALRGLPPVIVQDRGPDLYSAITRAASRTKRTVDKQIGRQRDTKRYSAWAAPDKRMIA